MKNTLLYLTLLALCGVCATVTKPAQARSCGANNQRPCTIFERIPSCDKGLYEDFKKNRCRKKAVPGKDCGRANQRPCTIIERIPSCNKGLVEDFSKNRCVKKAVPGKDCGRANQRPCTIVERIPSCNQGMVEDFSKNLCVKKAVPGVDCGNENQRPCTIVERIPSCNANLKEDFAKGICVSVPCGKELGRPCTIVERIPSCDKGLVENFLKGRCVPSKNELRHRIAGRKLEQIGGFIASKVGFAQQVASDPALKRSLEAGNERAVANSAVLQRAEPEQMPDGHLLRTISVGAAAGGHFIFVGTSGGAGAAIDLKGERPVYAYATGNYSFGPGLGAGGALDVGFWVCQNNKIGGDSWGIEFGVDDLAAAYVGALSMSKGPSLAIGLWFDYNNVFQGFTITPGFGVGVDFGGVVYAGTAVDGDESVGCDGRPVTVAQTPSAAFRASSNAPRTARRVASTQRLSSCPSNAQSLRGQRTAVTCSCSAAQTRSGKVWGTNPYTDDSRLCRAAVHAGIISSAGGTIVFRPADGRSSFNGSTRHGVTTSRYGAWPGGVTLSRP